MKLVSWNVNGLRSVMGKGFGNYLAVCGADVVCLQEVKATPAQVPSDLWEAHGYTAYWNAAARPGYAGTLTLSKVAPVSVTTGIGVEEGDREGRVLTLEFPGFRLVNVYTPNARGDLSRLDFRTRTWDPAFRAYLERLDESLPVVTCGDFNVAHQEIDLARPSSNRRSAGFTDEERAEFTAHIEAGFLDTFRLFCAEGGRYSWWSYRAGARGRNVGWRIDYFLASERLRPQIGAAEIRDGVPGSDHCPVELDLSV